MKRYKKGDKSGKNPNVVEEGDVEFISFLMSEIPESCRNQLLRSQEDIVSQPGIDPISVKMDDKSLTAVEVFRVAGERFIREKFIQSSSSGEGDPCRFRHSADVYYSGSSAEQVNDAELAGCLFSTAESVALEQFARATKLLNYCDVLSSCNGNTVQRLVRYFSEALRERIDRQRGNFSSEGLSKQPKIDVKDASVSSHPVILTCHRKIPFTRTLHLAGIQAIIENVADAKRVHVVDFGVRFGVCWTIFMQALTSREFPPLEILKLTAVGSGTMSKSEIEDTGNRLSAFAQGLNIPFTFSIVMVDDMLNLSEELFEVEHDEAVAFYASYLLRTMLCVPDRLEYVMTVIRSINPRIMVMIESEANTNAPCFGRRFTEALFYYSACFDCLETCMTSSDPDRIFIESLHCRQAIRNILATEGEMRTTRHVKLSVWRTFFARFGFSETRLSRSSLHEANSMLKEFTTGRYCNLDMEGKSLTIGWKGTPMVSVSAWKFV
uniref:Uncharacterized protein n=1 Tax=Kalanchoe fedtschenkoi TaxID=63787 RepID=A0A7N0UHC5_KALFE